MENRKKGGEEMPKRNVNAYVLCPYYKCDERQMIYCEGIEENSAIHMAFSTPQQRKEYENQYCKQCWAGCMIAGALNRKHDYEP